MLILWWWNTIGTRHRPAITRIESIQNVGTSIFNYQIWSIFVLMIQIHGFSLSSLPVKDDRLPSSSRSRSGTNRTVHYSRRFDINHGSSSGNNRGPIQRSQHRTITRDDWRPTAPHRNHQRRSGDDLNPSCPHKNYPIRYKDDRRLSGPHRNHPNSRVRSNLTHER